MIYYEIIGSLAGILSSISMIPQCYYIYIYNNTKNLNLLSFIFLLLGVLLWLIYGFLINSFSLIFFNLIQLSLLIYICYKIYINK
jgi:MtN3 and saliva related transmembrane protein